MGSRALRRTDTSAALAPSPCEGEGWGEVVAFDEHSETIIPVVRATLDPGATPRMTKRRKLTITISKSFQNPFPSSLPELLSSPRIFHQQIPHR